MSILDIFKKNKTQVFANQLDEIFNNPSIIESLIDKRVIENPHLILYKMGDILEYYITTRDTNKYFSFEEIIEKYNNYKLEHSEKEAEQNIIYNGFLTHSCNGFSLKRINKYGIGSADNIDNTLNVKLSRLEELLGVSKFVDNQQNTTTSYYLTSPGANSFNYACIYSPERLFLGPLVQSKDSALPIKVGESKTQYLKRVIDKKTENLSTEQKEEARNLGHDLIDNFFSDRPGVVLVPTKANLFVARSSFNSDGKAMPFMEYFESRGRAGLSEGYNFFSKMIGGINGNMGDLECVDSYVSRKEIGIFKCPDLFELFQKIALKRGMAKGDEIDYFTGVPKFNYSQTDSHKSNNYALDSSAYEMEETYTPTKKHL